MLRATHPESRSTTVEIRHADRCLVDHPRSGVTLYDRVGQRVIGPIPPRHAPLGFCFASALHGLVCLDSLALDATVG